MTVIDDTDRATTTDLQVRVIVAAGSPQAVAEACRHVAARDLVLVRMARGELDGRVLLNRLDDAIDAAWDMSDAHVCATSGMAAMVAYALDAPPVLVGLLASQALDYARPDSTDGQLAALTLTAVRTGLPAGLWLENAAAIPVDAVYACTTVIGR